eukprot:superscaffoldBa00000040_g728
MKSMPGAGGWSPLDSDHYQWLQVDLGSRKQVSAIATQGRYSSSDWTTRYRLLYSDTGRNWKPYHQDGNIWLTVSPTICQWITSFLTGRKQQVKLGEVTSGIWTFSTATPQKCVLSPLLFSLYTNKYTSKDPAVKLLKFADDTMVIGLIQDGQDVAFSGNSNSESSVRHELQQGIVARFLKLVPLDWSEEGRIGLRIEVYGCSYWADVINFDGQGVISYRFKVKKMKIIKDVIALRFKTSDSEGVILHGEGQQGDYITLELRKAKLLLQINLDCLSR